MAGSSCEESGNPERLSKTDDPKVHIHQVKRMDHLFHPEKQPEHRPQESMVFKKKLPHFHLTGAQKFTGGGDK